MAGKKSTEDLIIEAKAFFEIYKKEIGESIRKGKRVVFVNFEDLSSTSPTLVEALISSPEEILQVLEVALEETGLIKNPRIRFNNLPETQKVRIRTIRAQHLNQMIFFEGLVRQASEVRPQVVNARFECPSCGTVISVLQIEKKFREPSRCSCGRKGQFRLISKAMVDAQRLVIEESPESLSGGEQPRRLNVFLKEDLVEPGMEERTTPGSKVRVLGILKEVPIPLQTGAISTRFDLAIEANNLIPLESTYEELEISGEDERQIQELAADPELFIKLRNSIAPSIWGYEEIKEALVLQMFGGVKKTGSDGATQRGDIHLMLVGDPGVAKSTCLKFISNIAPKGRYIVGKASTGAGITATVVRDEYLRGWSLEAGAMVLSNRGVLCIDEIEKMDEQDRSAMHEALEQQCYLPDFKIMLADGSKIEIGEFVDELIEKNKEQTKEGNNCEILDLKENLKILTTDFESIYPTKINKVSRHLAPDKFVRIRLANGREITVTPEHPCWTIENGKIETNAAINLKKGDFFPVVYKKIRWSKIKSIEIIENKNIKWVYDIVINDTHSFISNNMVLHNSVTISKANVQASLRAETSVLAAGNPKYGRFEPMQSITEQIELPPTLLNRFDLIFILRDLPNKIQDDAIATHVLNIHQMKGQKADIERELFRKYIAYAKQKITPILADKAVEEIKNYYVRLRNMQTSGDLKAIPISARQLQGLVRLAEAHAKSRLSEEVTKKDVQVAIRLMNYYLMQVGFDPLTKTFDIDRFTTHVSSSQRNKIILLKETIRKLEEEQGKQVPLDLLRKELKDNVSDTEFEEAIEKLKKSGDIYQPKPGFVQLI